MDLESQKPGVTCWQKQACKLLALIKMKAEWKIEGKDKPQRTRWSISGGRLFQTFILFFNSFYSHTHCSSWNPRLQTHLLLSILRERKKEERKARTQAGGDSMATRRHPYGWSLDWGSLAYRAGLPFRVSCSSSSMPSLRDRACFVVRFMTQGLKVSF